MSTKIWTQKDVDKFLEENGNVKFPDCTSFKDVDFPEECLFGTECKFEYCNFDTSCVFEEYNKFEHCNFESCCTFGANSFFGRHCCFKRKCKFDDNCTFYSYCEFGADCTFGLRPQFGNRCLFTAPMSYLEYVKKTNMKDFIDPDNGLEVED